MKPHILVHRLALLLLAIVAGMSLLNMFRPPRVVWPPFLLTFTLALAFWGLLIHKLWHQPRRWSLRVSLLLVFMLAFQTYLWHRALAGPLPEQLGLSRGPWVFALYELPILAGAICCLYLRWSCLPTVVAPEATPPA